MQVNIAPQAHQGELVRLAHHLLPPGLSERGFPSVYHESHLIQIKCMGSVSQEAIEAAKQDFYAQTGWQLELDVQPSTQAGDSLPVQVPTGAHMDQHGAIHVAQSLLRDLPGYMKVGAEPGCYRLHVRFHFPDVARQRL